MSININKKTSIERQKQMAEKNLAIRLEQLKSKGWDDKRIQKDTKVKQLKAQRREQKQRLIGIAARESLVLSKAETKTQKIEALKSAPPKAKKIKTSPEVPKKAKKERKTKAASEE